MVLVIIAERWSLAASYRDLFEALSEYTINMVFGSLGKQGPDGGFANSHLPSNNSLMAAVPSNEASTQFVFDDSQLDNWLVNAEQMNVPDESEWLVHDFIRGFATNQGENDIDGLHIQII